MKKILVTLIAISFSVINLNGSSLENILNNNKVFVGLGLGYSNLHIEKNDKLGNVDLLEKQNRNSRNISSEIGYYYNENLEVSLNYQFVDNDDVDIDNIFVSTKYVFPERDYSSYLGVNLGYSKLSWNKNPISTQNNDNKSGSYLVGTSVGILYPISSNVDFNVNYSLFYMGHKTYLKTTSSDISELRHDFLQSINIALRYNF